LHASDLKIIGVYLFGPRWQCQLARAIHYSERQMRYWVAEERPVSIAASARIEALVRHKHGQQMRRTRAFYLDMIAGLSDTRIKARLLMMDLAALRLDNQVRQTALIEADLVLALVAEINPEPAESKLADIKAGVESGLAGLHTLCTVSYCALRAIATPPPPHRPAELGATHALGNGPGLNQRAAD
jgi:hypothetical protein